MALDIGLAWLGDPMGFYEQPPQVQTDLMAYHLIALEKGAATRLGLVAAGQRTSVELALDNMTIGQSILKLNAARFRGDVPDIVGDYVRRDDTTHRESVKRRLTTEAGATNDAATWWLEHD